MSTISISLNRRITEKVKPPRALVVGFPLGHPMGNPYDHALQKRILLEALKYLQSVEEPGTILDRTEAYGIKTAKCTA
jgi:D-proline reductase (dithiol) PrdB